MVITQSKNIISLKIDAEITDKVYKEITNAFESHIATFGNIKVFLVVNHYTSINSAESLYEDLRFLKVYADHIEKTAVVCDKTWKKTWVALFGLFAKIRMGFYDKSEFRRAWDWISAEGDPA